MKLIRAKYKSKCHNTGKTISKGDQMYYDYGTKKCYSIESIDKDKEAKDTANFIQAEQEAYFDNFCLNNNI